MDWEAILMRFPDGVVAEDIPKDWQPPAIGTLAEVKSTLETAFPHGEHDAGQSTVRGEEFQVEFSFCVMDESDDSVRAISVRSNASLDAVPILRSASEEFDCRLFDLQAGLFADFGEQTEASMSDFVVLRSRMKRERRWAFSVTVAVLMVFHALQDSGTIPAVERLSKGATGVYGFMGLIFLNVLAFLSSVMIALGQAKSIDSEVAPQEEKERMEEAILVPAFRGEGSPPPLVARYLHIPVGALLGMIAGSILAGILSLLIF